MVETGLPKMVDIANITHPELKYYIIETYYIKSNQFEDLGIFKRESEIKWIKINGSKNHFLPDFTQNIDGLINDIKNYYKPLYKLLSESEYNKYLIGMI